LHALLLLLLLLQQLLALILLLKNDFLPDAILLLLLLLLLSLSGCKEFQVVLTLVIELLLLLLLLLLDIPLSFLLCHHLRLNFLQGSDPLLLLGQSMNRSPLLGRWLDGRWRPTSLSSDWSIAAIDAAKDRKRGLVVPDGIEGRSARLPR